MEYPPLAPEVTLRRKIPKDQISQKLKGRWRVQAKPDEGEPYSYGLLITQVDANKLTFKGESAAANKFKIEEGRIVYNEKNGRCMVFYTEVWANGQRDKLEAHFKSNGKLQYDGVPNCKQTATREDLNLPEDGAASDSPAGVKKYYTGDSLG